MSQGSRIVTAACKNSPTLHMAPLVWEKIWKITQENKFEKKAYECSSFGILDPNDPCKALDIYVPEQKNGPSSTLIDPSDHNRWIAELIKLGIDPSQASVWHHTHADMDVFWSTTDTDTIEAMATDGIHWSIVTNCSGDIKVRADIFYPVRYWWDDCDYEVDYPTIDLNSWWEKQQSKLNNEPVRAIGYSFGKKTPSYGWKKPNHVSPELSPITSRWDEDWAGWNVNVIPDDLLPQTLGQEEVFPRRLYENHIDEDLSDGFLQDCYDDGLVSHDAALELEKKFLNGEIKKKGLHKKLRALKKSAEEQLAEKEALMEDLKELQDGSQEFILPHLRGQNGSGK